MMSVSHGKSESHEHDNDEDYHKLDNHGAHEEEEGEGPWLMSFADMVTLLMCFFILFFSTDKGNVEVDDPEKLKRLLEQQIEASETGEDINLPSGSSATQTQSATQAHSASEAQTSQEQFQALFSDLREAFKQTDLAVTVHKVQPGIIEIILLSVQFFEAGEASPTRDGAKAISAIGTKLKRLPPKSIIEVEGHTDSDPVTTTRFPSNWELSTARASSVVRQLAKVGVDPRSMKATGLANYHPVVPERDGRGFSIIPNKALNRRIVIRLKAPSEPSDSAPASEASKQGKSAPANKTGTQNGDKEP